MRFRLIFPQILFMFLAVFLRLPFAALYPEGK